MVGLRLRSLLPENGRSSVSNENSRHCRINIIIEDVDLTIKI